MRASGSDPVRLRQDREARSIPRLLAFLGGVILLPAAQAQADIFDRLTATFGAPDTVGLRCHENPHTITFSADRGRSVFRWSGEIIDYLGGLRIAGEYMVHAHDAASITMQITDEQRRTREGEPVVWILREVTEPDGYCWGRTDWPASRCEGFHKRCVGDVPSS